MKKVQFIEDKLVIIDIRSLWGEALDNKNWDLFASLFTEDVDTDFSAWGIPPQKIHKAQLVGTFSHGSFRHENLITQHLYTNFRIKIEGDKAVSVCNFLGQHFIPNFEGGEFCTLRGEYTDGLVRTHEGWKIHSLKFKQFFMTGNPKILG